MSFPSPTKKQARVMWFSLTALSWAVILALFGLACWGFGWLLHRLSGVLMPMGFALVLAYILNPVVEFFERKEIPRMWAVCLVFFLGILVVTAVFGSILPDISRESSKLVEELPKNVEYLHQKALHYLGEMPASVRNAIFPEQQRGQMAILTTSNTVVITNLPEVATNLPATNSPATNSTTETNVAPGSAPGEKTAPPSSAGLNEKMMPGMTRAALVVAKWLQDQLGKVTTWAEFLIGFVLVPIYLFYFLLEKDSITEKWPDYLPLKDSRVKEELVFILKNINDCMVVFFRGQVLVALCVAVLLSAAYLIMGLNYALLLGMVAGLLEIVPYLGTIVGLVLALAVSGIQFKDWTHPLIVFGIVVLMKFLEDLVIAPRILGKRVGLHPLAVIVAVMVGTTLLGGFIGALLAIPLTAALRTLMFRYVWVKDKTGKNGGAGV
jgi:predicted PurR-regulated permease PerM